MPETSPGSNGNTSPKASSKSDDETPLAQSVKRTAHENYTPLTHIGSLYRSSWTPSRGVLTYHLLGTGTKYHLVWDGSYNMFWVRREDFRSQVGCHARNEQTTVFPTGDDVDGIGADSPRHAAAQMVAWLRENVAEFEVPSQVNGWQKVPAIASIEYQSPDNTGLIILESTSSGYNAKVQGDATGVENLAHGVETRSDALTEMVKFMKKTSAIGYGLPDKLDVDSEYGDFERTGAGMGEVARWEHPDGFRIYITRDGTESDDNPYTVCTSTGPEKANLGPAMVDKWLVRFRDHLQSSPEDPYPFEQDRTDDADDPQTTITSEGHL